MKTTRTISQLVALIAEATDKTTVATLFQELYAQIREHYYHAFYALAWNEFRIDEQSMVAEEAFYKVLEETENDIHEKKFKADRYEGEESLRKGLLSWMLYKVVGRIKNGFDRRRRQAMNAADLSDGQQRAFENTQSADISDYMIEAQSFIFERLSAKDADIIRTFFYETIGKDDATRLLMQQYDIPTEAAFKRAAARARDRYKELLRKYQTERSTVKL